MEEEAATEPEGHKVPPAPHPHTSYDDSGYSSDVFTSPEFPREGLRPPVVGASGSQPCATPEVINRVATRLTSTPHDANTKEAFRLPLPKVAAISRTGRTRYDSTSASPATTSTTTLEMCELEVACVTATPTPSTREQGPGGTERRRPALSPSAPVPRMLSRHRRHQHAFVRLLREADYLVRRVLKYLTGQELLRVAQVNRQLRDLILNDKQLSFRRSAYICKKKGDRDRIGKENSKLKRLNEGNGSSYGTLSPRKGLAAIQNLCPASPRKALSFTPDPSPSDCFMEEGKKLPNGGELQKCVKCKFPATVQKSQQRALCSNKSCGYDYCTSCHLAFHRRPQDCLVLKPRTRQRTGIFSKSKRNLRRL